MSAKVILICGPGPGKTFVGDALSATYTARAVLFDRVFGSEAEDVAAIVESKAEYVIVESNYLDGKIDYWQRICVSSPWSEFKG